VTARPVTYARTPPPPTPPIPAIELPTLTFRDAAIGLGLVSFLPLFLPFAGAVIMALVGKGADPAGGLKLSIAGKWIEAAMICGIALFLCWRRRLPAAAVGLYPERIRWQIGWSIIGLIACYVWLFASAVVLAPLLPGLADDLEQRRKVFELLPHDSVGRQIALFAAVVIHEELWFRGLLLPYLRKVTGHWWAAVVISACVFGALHIAQGILGVIQVTGLGIVLSLVFIRTRSLLTVMLAHFVFDLAQTWLAERLLPWLDDLPSDLV
jgi:membrane protease YdiL (CAAX protease family)